MLSKKVKGIVGHMLTQSCLALPAIFQVFDYEQYAQT